MQFIGRHGAVRVCLGPTCPERPKTQSSRVRLELALAPLVVLAMAGRVAAHEMVVSGAPGSSAQPASVDPDLDEGRGLRDYLLTRYKTGKMTATDVCTVLGG